MTDTAASRPNRAFVGGWLSMAPESETAASPTASSSTLAEATGSSSPHNVSHTNLASISSTRRRTSALSSSSQTNRATFQLGAADDTSSVPTPVTPASRGSSASMLSPVFDVRSSFAPMTFNKRPSTLIQEEATSLNFLQPATNPTSDGSHGTGSEEQKGSSLHHIEDDGKGLEFAGRRWKGKTAHAVEQELEQVGDTTIMSYAPDAVYLASRLEGLRRNLEAGGEEARGRRWLDLGDAEETITLQARDEEVKALPLATTGEVEDVDPRALQVAQPANLTPSQLSNSDSTSMPAIETPSQQSTIREDRLHATLPPHIADLLRPQPPFVREQPLAGISPAAKAAALDSRIEIRLLRRSDLEQVRELHCLHGDNDKVDTEHYATSAAFLLRLLVDETHVCLVAVAKPLPEPETPFERKRHHHHLQHTWPTPPPPSMDMPVSSAAYLLAGQGISSNSPLLRPIDTLTAKTGGRQRSCGAPSSSLGKHTPVLGAMKEEDGDADSDADSMKADQDDEEGPNLSISGFSSPVSPLRISASLSPALSQSVRAPPLASPSQMLLPAFAPLPQSKYGSDNADGSMLSQDDSYSSSTSLSSGTPLKRPYETRLAATTQPLRLEDGEVLSSLGSSKCPTSQYGLPPGHDLILTGPTNEVAPPRALRVMVPPAPGASIEAETILGVASASISIRPATESLWGPIDAPASQAVKEVHILTLSVARAERGLGLGGRLLDRLLDEALRRHVSSAYRASMGRRVPIGSAEPFRIYLEVHPDSEHALALYKGRGFEVARRLPGYFRGDARIPTHIRSLPGGSDAVLMEKSETPRPNSDND